MTSCCVSLMVRVIGRRSWRYLAGIRYPRVRESADGKTVPDPNFSAEPGTARGAGRANAEHGVDQPVVLRLVRRHEVVALRVGVHLVDRSPGVARHQLLHPALEREDLAGPDLDVGGLALEAA